MKHTHAKTGIKKNLNGSFPEVSPRGCGKLVYKNT